MSEDCKEGDSEESPERAPPPQSEIARRMPEDCKEGDSEESPERAASRRRAKMRLGLDSANG